MTTIFRSELYLRLRHDPVRDQFVDQMVGTKVVFQIERPRASGRIYRLYARPPEYTEAFACTILDIPVIKNQPCYILAPEYWHIAGMFSADATPHNLQRLAIPFTELSVNTKQ